MITAIVAALLIILSNIIILLYVKSTIKRNFQAYFEAPDKETPSAFFQLTDMMAKQWAYHIMHQFKSTNAGLASGEARQEKAMSQAIVKDVAQQQNPLLGIALNQFPNLTKLVAKNPELLNIAQQVMSNFKNKGGGNHEDIEAVTQLENTFEI